MCNLSLWMPTVGTAMMCGTKENKFGSLVVVVGFLVGSKHTYTWREKRLRKT